MGDQMHPMLQYIQHICNYSGYTGDINVSYTYPSTVGGNPNPMVYPGSSTSYPPYGWPGHASNTATTSTAYANSSYRKVKDTNYKIPTAGYVQFKWLIRTNANGTQTNLEMSTMAKLVLLLTLPLIL